MLHSVSEFLLSITTQYSNFYFFFDMKVLKYIIYLLCLELESFTLSSSDMNE